MHESEPDNQFPDDPKVEQELPTGVTEIEGVAAPSQAELIQIALLMRIYDAQMELLRHFNPTAAEVVYEAHERGEHGNPPVFLPDWQSDADA